MTSLFIGADHAGFALKETLKTWLKKTRKNPQDLTPQFVPGDDYPRIAFRLAQAVSAEPKALGILICGTGHGMDIAANRILGARASVIRSPEDAIFFREENHGNVLVLGAWTVKPVAAKRIIQTWLKTKPSSSTRHERRVSQLDAST